jgi:hypothetical protein
MGIVLTAIAVALIVYICARAADADWSVPFGLILLAVAVGAFALVAIVDGWTAVGLNFAIALVLELALMAIIAIALVVFLVVDELRCIVTWAWDEITSALR